MARRGSGDRNKWDRESAWAFGAIMVIAAVATAIFFTWVLWFFEIPQI